MTQISASILGCNTAYLGETVVELEKAGVDILHVDVTDGWYVNNLTFGPQIVKDMRPLTGLPIEVHLGVYNPERYIRDFVNAGADIITVQMDCSVHPLRIFRKIRGYGKMVGVAINPCQGLEEIKYCYDLIDYLKIMGVEPGFGGQVFEDLSYGKIKQAKELLRDLSHDIPIGVDGGVNFKNFQQITQAGANILVIGSALFSTQDIIGNVRKFKGLTG